MTRSAKGKNCRDDNSISMINLTELYEAPQGVEEVPEPQQQHSLPTTISAISPHSLSDDSGSDDGPDNDLFEVENGNNDEPAVPIISTIRQQHSFHQRLLQQVEDYSKFESCSTHHQQTPS